MKNKIIILLGMIFLIGMISMISAELYQTQSMIVDNSTSTMHFVGYYKVDDTNANNLSTGTPTNLKLLWNVVGLPYQTIDYCNLTIAKTLFSNLMFGISISNVTTYDNYYYNSGNTPISSSQSYALYGNDYLQVDLTCHYGNISKFLLQNYIAGSIELTSSSFGCQECSNYNYGSLINESQSYNPYAIYDKVQQVISWDWEAWLIFEWIIRILFIFIGIALIFAGVYWIYIFISNLEREISRR